jgi:hypothetical protein
MAAKHILSLELPPVSNCEIFSVKDTSQYADNVPVECPELLILPPGFSVPLIVEVQPNFNLNLTPCSLGLQTYNCDNSTGNFIDGVYVIRYRVQPHEKVYVEYNHLRITSIMRMYHQKLCDLDITPCELPSAKKKVLQEMHYIKTMIDAAKAKVEYCNSPDEGIELYNFALSKLKKITCDIDSGCSSTC